MAILVAFSSLFGSYTTVLVVILSLLLWMLFSTPSQSCPFGNHISKSSQVKNEENIATSSLETSTGETPKKKTIKPKKKCSGGGCTKKINLDNKTLTIYFGSGDELGLAQRLQSAAQNIGFQSSLTRLDKSFDVDEVLPRVKQGANLFILRENDAKVPSTSVKWFHDWLFDGNRGKTLLAEMQFAVLGADQSDIKVIEHWDKRLWRLGAQRLKKPRVAATEEELETWTAEMMCILTGKPAKQCCSTTNKGGCSSESSCGSSDEDGPPTIVDVEDLLLSSKRSKLPNRH